MVRSGDFAVPIQAARTSIPLLWLINQLAVALPTKTANLLLLTAHLA
jgi:hypothetical protein